VGVIVVASFVQHFLQKYYDFAKGLPDLTLRLFLYISEEEKKPRVCEAANTQSATQPSPPALDLTRHKPSAQAPLSLQVREDPTRVYDPPQRKETRE
jgi:hypothetical protein